MSQRRKPAFPWSKEDFLIYDMCPCVTRLQYNVSTCLGWKKSCFRNLNLQQRFEPEFTGIYDEIAKHGPVEMTETILKRQRFSTVAPISVSMKEKTSLCVTILFLFHPDARNKAALSQSHIVTFGCLQQFLLFRYDDNLSTNQVRQLVIPCHHFFM